METAYVLALVAIFLAIWFGLVLGTMIAALVAGKRRTIAAGQFVMFAAPVTYLVWFFLMRG